MLNSGQFNNNFKINLRSIVLIAIDILIIFIAYLITMFVYGVEFILYLKDIPLIGAVCIVIFLLNGLSMTVWRYASFDELNRLIWSSITVATLYIGIAYMIWPYDNHFVFSMLFAVAYLVGLIVSRLIYCIYYRSRRYSTNVSRKRVAIIGGGYLGATVLRNIAVLRDVIYDPICIFDDDQSKLSRKIGGVKIVGNLDRIPDVCKRLKIDELILAISNMDEKQRERIFSLCEQTDCKIKKVPDIEKILVEGENEGGFKLENIKIEDLLGREVVELSDENVRNGLKGKVVLVTGGGGSIGSELCRQIAMCEVKQLIILDIYENNAYEIQQELIRKYGSRLDLHVEIASVRDSEKIEEIFKLYKPQFVYHAAAHKHVPLMETNPEEAVKNNIFGTYNVAMSAHNNNVEKFVFISTDKAVNPTNFMGATKRFCEMIIQSMKDFSKTKYSAVRFGNVLGSNGSVIPLFKRQIENGGPVTVTHPNIIRYFMVIPEAVRLVMTAGATAENGTVFVLDMGKPVRIADLASKMIKLSGYIPNKDIDIVYTGLRPGEKMYEELLVKSDNVIKTGHDKIFVENLEQVTREEVSNALCELNEVLKTKSREKLIEKMCQFVKTYTPTPNENAEEEVKKAVS